MALLTSEIMRIRVELGYNLMGVGAEPYINIVSMFNSVIQSYMTAGASTTCSTPVVEADTPTPQTLALVSGTGISVGDIVVVDVDYRQEKATIAHMLGSNITVQLSKAHTGSYPVTVEGGESMVREIVKELQALRLGGLGGVPGAMSKIKSRAGIKKVDDVEFFGGAGPMSQGVNPLTQFTALVEYWRDELAAALGVVRLNRRGGGGAVEVY